MIMSKLLLLIGQLLQCHYLILRWGSRIILPALEMKCGKLILGDCILRYHFISFSLFLVVNYKFSLLPARYRTARTFYTIELGMVVEDPEAEANYIKYTQLAQYYDNEVNYIDAQLGKIFSLMASGCTPFVTLQDCANYTSTYNRLTKQRPISNNFKISYQSKAQQAQAALYSTQGNSSACPAQLASGLLQVSLVGSLTSISYHCSPSLFCVIFDNIDIFWICLPPKFFWIQLLQ